MKYSWLQLPAGALAGVAYAQVAIATQYLSIEQAQQALFPTATAFKPTLLALSDSQREFVRKAAKTRTPLPDKNIRQVFAGEQALGWLVIDEVYGKHEFITYAVALDTSGTVLGIEILDYRETHGYQVRNANWRAQFVGKQFGAPLKLDNDIANISGATLSCLHLAEGVRRVLALHEIALKQG
jgi:Na+-translocating ferredoxin:NAD+ oxidoreductase RnfG subunit